MDNIVRIAQWTRDNKIGWTKKNKVRYLAMDRLRVWIASECKTVSWRRSEMNVFCPVKPL
jgi:hypothetical protein